MLFEASFLYFILYISQEAQSYGFSKDSVTNCIVIKAL